MTVRHYTLKTEEQGKVLFVDGRNMAVTLALRNGPMTLRGLSVQEIAKCGLLLYQPVNVELMVTLTPKEESSPSEGQGGGEP